MFAHMPRSVTIITFVRLAVMPSLGLCLEDKLMEWKMNKKEASRGLLGTLALRDLDQPLQLIF